jgi:hypothetical protein
MNLKRTKIVPYDLQEIARYFYYPGDTVLKKTIENTTRLGTINTRVPMRQHYKSRNPLLQRRRIKESYVTDTWFSRVTSYEGYNCAQVFYGMGSKMLSHYGMVRESNGPEVLLDFFRQEGVPISLTRDNSKMQASQIWTEYCRRYWVKDSYIEPYYAHQNPVERAMAVQKDKLERLMIDTGCDPRAWFRAACHVADVHNHTACEIINYRTPTEVRDGYTPDISGLIQHHFWDQVYYKDFEHGFPTEGGNERKVDGWGVL